MDSFSKPVRMNPDMVRLLDRMRRDAEPYPVYQQPAAKADQKICAVAQSLLTDANLAAMTRMHYMWYVRELARLLRTRYGRDLAFHLELVMRKWQDLGLSPNILQILACEVHNALRPSEAILPVVGSSFQPAARPRKGRNEEPPEAPAPAPEVQ